MTQKPLTFTQAYEACLALTREAFPTIKGHLVKLQCAVSTYFTPFANLDHHRSTEFILVVVGVNPQIGAIEAETLEEIIACYETELCRKGLIIRNGERMASIDL